MEFFGNINIIFFIVAYLVGSIPFGVILAKQFAGVDVTSSGSKSIGATNVLRVVKETNPALAKKLGIATLALDALKGTLVVLAGMYVGLSLETLWGVAILALLGHCYSAYLKLEGGKGVATALGVLIVLLPIPTIIGGLVWAISAKVLKISSLSSLLGLIGVIVSTWVFADGLGIESNIPLYIIAFIVIYKHIPNIVRIIKGEEKKIEINN
ncbi:glycerol-3-phosphate 1-O-acyltransferase PlsY [Arcobacter sp. FWKO B]|uniref:glycerol-3-phosphate 1-O-acyltransferase PlsY n=1 Tax=Arcobacter sp. FWKO B TaxID=2593672 RepID=UPI0018A482E3|nr:glycerol-3-phosphate 1-O-acyltransferase PlsY [Arcobacter sp. FWKO B]QOG12622.1 glycerol-3-phosphate 1-O-acyltransferase PlsY [Arcobacter sp. FWKO B]